MSVERSPAETTDHVDQRRAWGGRLLLLGLGILASLGVAALGAGMATGVGQDPTGEVDAPFTQAPDFSLTDFDGEPFALSDYADRPVLIYFWASWCDVCDKVSPRLQRLWPEYQARGYEFVGINILDREEDALAKIDEHGMTFTNLYDRDGAVYLDYGVYGVPEMFFLRPGLVLQEKYLGDVSEEALREKLDRLARGASTPQ